MCHHKCVSLFLGNLRFVENGITAPIFYYPSTWNCYEITSYCLVLADLELCIDEAGSELAVIPLLTSQAYAHHT